MNRGPIKLLKDMVKVDLGSGFVVSLIIVMLSSFIYAKIYLIGLILSLINFIVNVYITINCLGYNNRNKYITVISTMISIVKISLIIIIAMFFINDIVSMSYYMFGFISHYILLIFNCIKNRKGSV